SSIARKYNISELVIGLTVVAFGTSMPEFCVSLLASARNQPDLAIANIIGSNIANILLILGVSAVICPLTVTRGTTWREIPMSLLAAVVLGVMANDVLFNHTAQNVISRSDGIVLLAFLTIFMAYILGIARAVGNSQHPATKERTIPTALGLLAIGVLMLSLGGQMIVECATAIARLLGASETLIGLTIVAVGTSLPELATSAMAAYRKNADIAVGNIVGSNILNIFWILGISATVHPLHVNSGANADVLVTVLATAALFAFMLLQKGYELKRWHGMLFVSTYAVYLVYIIQRG
ncbi:MAG: sodium:proton exchanger, partial [Candidatus Komeilibacteria bacterium RIFCSPLOWO2_01_FULL_53_11]